MTARIVVLLPDKFTVYVPISLDISAICPALSRSHLDTYRQSGNDKLNARIDEEVGRRQRQVLGFDRRLLVPGKDLIALVVAAGGSK